VQVLQSNPRMSLERAYISVVNPKLAVNKDQVYKEQYGKAVQALKKAPSGSTSAPARAIRQVARPSGEARDTTDIIMEAIREAKEAGLK
jgi:hypothetical protein